MFERDKRDSLNVVRLTFENFTEKKRTIFSADVKLDNKLEIVCEDKVTKKASVKLSLETYSIG